MYIVEKRREAEHPHSATISKTIATDKVTADFPDDAPTTTVPGAWAE
jgi:hypothetical protein